MTDATADAILRRLREIGDAFSPEVIAETRALFAPHQPDPDAVGCRVQRDARYGPDERHRLDVFAPAQDGAARPVLMYVHGGGFSAGDKGDAGSPFFSGLGAWAVANGLVGVNMTYRLAPAHAYPAGAEDVAAAVAWVRANVAGHGGDPQRVFVLGQSAGAVHLATYLARADLQPAEGPGLAGAMLSSGLYDLGVAERNPILRSYFGDDETLYAQRSTLQALLACELPLLFTVAEFDPPDFQRQAARLVEAFVQANGRWPRLLQLSDQNHLSGVLQIGTPVDRLGAELLRFIARFG